MNSYSEGVEAILRENAERLIDLAVYGQARGSDLRTWYDGDDNGRQVMLSDLRAQLGSVSQATIRYLAEAYRAAQALTDDHVLKEYLNTQLGRHLPTLMEVQVK